MEEYFEKGTIPKSTHLRASRGIREDRIFPVLFSSGLANMATDHLLDFLKAYAPSPIERAPIPVHAPYMKARPPVPTQTPLNRRTPQG